MTKSIQHSCGHSSDYDVKSNADKRQQTIQWLSEQECRNCKIAKERMEAQKTRSLEGLPLLQGSAKQIAWAETIRAIALKAVNYYMITIDEAYSSKSYLSTSDKQGWGELQQQDIWLHQEQSAAWWIDHRRYGDVAAFWMASARKPIVPDWLKENVNA